MGLIDPSPVDNKRERVYPVAGAADAFSRVELEQFIELLLNREKKKPRP